MPEEQRRRAYRDGALRIGEGQTISQPWIVACMAQLLELRRRRDACSRWAPARATPPPVALCAGGDDRALRGLGEAADVLGELGYDNVEVRVGDGSGRARARAVRRISVTATARRPPALFDSSPGAALVCPVDAGAASCSCAFATATEAAVRFVPSRCDVIREFSPAAWYTPLPGRRSWRVPRARLWRCRRATPTPASRRRPPREVREEPAGDRAVEKLDDIRYWYAATASA